MQPKFSHNWDLPKAGAEALQLELRGKVRPTPLSFEQVELVAGVDVAYSKDGKWVVAGVAVMDVENFHFVEVKTHVSPIQKDYYPGLFSFRELPSIMEALIEIEHTPGLFICDAHGLAHPRRFGLACHLGVLYDVPTIGCAKNRLIGEYDEPGQTRGSTTELTSESASIGQVVRTQTNIKPVFVSVGHKITLNQATEWILRLSPTYRINEPLRRADQCVRKIIKEIT